MQYYQMKKLIYLLTALILFGCGRRQAAVQVVVAIDSADSVAIKTITSRCEANSIYHWKTTFNPTESGMGIYREHDIKRLYLRFFDVALDNHWLEEQLAPIPIATTVFSQIPSEDMETIPVVYITLDAMRDMKGQEAEYADKIVTRVLAMTKRHKIRNVYEIQLDCDWTGTTRESYFKLCQAARDSLHKQGIALSVTVRLHQLNETLYPPVDRGVLMLYNTGGLKNTETVNSILDSRNVESYLKKTITYGIPLDYAYPTFAWGVWFSDGKFRAILHNTNFSDEEFYQWQSKNMYKVIKNHYLESHALNTGDIIRLENSDYEEVLKVKKRVESKLQGYSVILYHLDSANLSQYTYNEIKNIYDHY